MRQGVGIEDSGMAFYDAMHGLQDFANQTIPGAGNLVKPLIEGAASSLLNFLSKV